MTIARRDAVTQKTSFKPALSGEKFRIQPGITIYATPFERASLGIMVPKRFISLSVDRHRLKRRIAAQVVPIEGLMVVVRVMGKIDTEVDISPITEWFKQRALQNKEEPVLAIGELGQQ
jgi:RNase P protein component